MQIKDSNTLGDELAKNNFNVEITTEVRDYNNSCIKNAPLSDMLTLTNATTHLLI